MVKKLSQQDFIKRAKSVHGSSYDYSMSKYSGVDNKIDIICPKHGLFQQRAMRHLRGGGCKQCAIDINANSKRNSSEKIINEFRKMHGEKFDYSNVKYINIDTKVEIKCIKHNHKFYVTPYKHKVNKGGGCKDCVNENARKRYIKSLEEFKKDARSVHGDKYDYSAVEYKGARVDVLIGCSNENHGFFFQTPNHHINSKEGCPACAHEVRNLGFTIDEISRNGLEIDGTLYVIHAYNDNESFYKIGITTKTTDWRFRGKSDMPYDYEIITELKIGLRAAYEHEQYVLKELAKYKYIPKIYFPGKDEVLSVNPLEYDERLRELHFNQNIDKRRG